MPPPLPRRPPLSRTAGTPPSTSGRAAAPRPPRADPSRGPPRGVPPAFYDAPSRGSYDYPPPSTARAPPGGGGGRPPPPTGGGGGDGGVSNLTKAFVAGAFVVGMGTGVWFNSEATLTPSNVASTELIDRKTPNSEVCMANGYSSMVFDQRIFVSFNPFNVYVTQPEVKPGCVVRRSNIGLLERKALVTAPEVAACTKNMNTFAFVGDLDGQPEVACVYHSEDAENQFLKDPKRSALEARSKMAQGGG